jgi:glutamate racemase
MSETTTPCPKTPAKKAGALPPDRERDLAEQKNQPIGVFDSGVGGLTVVSAVLSRLPHERILYLGDTARVPYGTRSQKTVERYARNAARFLLQKRVKLLLIACNTASAAALITLQNELPVGVIGAVEPGAFAAAQKTRTGHVGVLGTLATIRSGAYERALLQKNPALHLSVMPCPLLVPVVEEGITDPADPLSQLAVRRYLAPLAHKDPALDTLVLGCTHYPLLRPVLSQVAAELWSHPVGLVDSADTMAACAQAYLQEHSLLADPPIASQPPTDRLRCFVTDEARVAEVAARFLHPSFRQTTPNTPKGDASTDWPTDWPIELVDL